jgi:uncharacterized protein YceK
MIKLLHQASLKTFQKLDLPLSLLALIRIAICLALVGCHSSSQHNRFGERYQKTEHRWLWCFIWVHALPPELLMDNDMLALDNWLKGLCREPYATVVSYR